MICPLCGKDGMLTGEFYDHMGEYHAWSLADAEKHADDEYLEKHGERKQ